MRKAIIIYSTTDGQTKKICKRLLEQLKVQIPVDLYSINEIEKINLGLYETIIIGASVRYGKHSSQLYDFIEKNTALLTTKFTAFFTVNATARNLEKSTPKTNPYMQKFLKLSKWKPTILGVFAGKIDYPAYKFTDRQMIRLIMYITNGPTNLRETYEFTNWDNVEKFGLQILEN